MILLVLSLAPIAENKLFNVTCLKKVMRSRKITYIIKNTHWQPRKIFSWFLFWLSIAIPPKIKLTLLGDYYTLSQTLSYITVSIKNYGKTIPADELGHIFDKFYRSKEYGESEESGTGLGLAPRKNSLYWGIIIPCWSEFLILYFFLISYFFLIAAFPQQAAH